MSDQKPNDFPISPIFLSNIKEFGYTFCGVFDNEKKEPNFIYTISATGTLGAELIALGNTPVNAMQGIMFNIIDNFPIKPGVIELTDFKVKVGDEIENLRINIVEVTGEEWLDKTLCNRSEDFNKVYQLLFGDINNKLPTDKNNLDELQQLFHRPKHPIQ